MQNELQFLVDGKYQTRTEILGTAAMDRTVAGWQVLVDWDLHRTRPYVVVDPVDPEGLLYLTRTEYLNQCKVCVSNDLQLIVVARPGTKAPSPVQVEPSSSQTTPPHHVVEGEFGNKWSRASKASWRTFLDLRTQVRRGVNIAKTSRTMVSETEKTIARTVLLWTRQLLHYAEVDKPGNFPRYLIPLMSHLQTLLRNNGQMAAVQHLKVSLFALYSYVSGNPLSSTTPLGYGVRLRHGLPAIWDRQLRDFIRNGNMSVIRIMASLLNLYRAMDAPHPELDLKSITQPAPLLEGKPMFEQYRHFCKEIFPTLVSGHTRERRLPTFEYKSADGMLIRTAGANLSGPSIAGIILDAQAWSMAPSNHVMTWFERFGDFPMEMTMQALERELHFRDADAPCGPTVLGPTYGSMLSAVRASKACPDPSSPSLGRLHVIEEPAGKNRVVAICDYFTQVALKPVHDHLFEILKLLHCNDATFDQDKSVMDYFKKGYKPHWSFDLKTATDSIPLALYKEVLTPFLDSGKGEEFAKETVDLWAKIIADRDFVVDTGRGLQTVRYGTGQPMGALSSWASMALVHHSLVQFANYLAFSKTEWFSTYLILGDDIDISVSEPVAIQYQNICAEFGITIGIAKSLKSNENFFEFANRRFSPSGDISPLSVREELQSSTWTARAEYAKRILSRFGTAVRNETSAFLRKAVTAAQWTVLVPEMSGRRSSTMLRLVRYCLLNPFQRSWKEISISSILEWLTEILPDPSVVKPYLVDSGKAEHLELSLVTSIAGKISQDLNSILRDLPKMVQPDLYELGRLAEVLHVPWNTFATKGPLGNNAGMEDFWSGRINQFSRSLMPEVHKATRLDNPSLGYVPHSPVAWAYFNYCVFQHNKSLVAQVDKLLYALEQKVKRLPPIVDGEPVCPVDDVMETSLPYWMDLWFQVRQLPKPLIIDTRKSVKDLLEYDSFRNDTLREAQGLPKVIPETIYGPMQEVAKLLAYHLGVIVPGLPFFNDGRRGRSWYRSLRDCLKHYKMWKDLLARFDTAWLYAEQLEAGKWSNLFLECQDSIIETMTPDENLGLAGSPGKSNTDTLMSAMKSEVYRQAPDGLRLVKQFPDLRAVQLLQLRQSADLVVALAAASSSSERSGGFQFAVVGASREAMLRSSEIDAMVNRIFDGAEILTSLFQGEPPWPAPNIEDAAAVLDLAIKAHVSAHSLYGGTCDLIWIVPGRGMPIRG